jgi:hypothetical protein
MDARTVITTTAIGLFATSVLFAKADRFDAASFEQLTDEQKQAFVLGVLWDREAQLQNFSYEIVEHVERFTPKDGNREFLREESYGVKRKNEQLFLHAEKLDSQNRQLNLRTRWDGTMAKSLVHRPYRTDRTYSGTITDSEHNNFTYRAYNWIFGLRMPDTECMTLAEWFKDSVNKALTMVIVIAEQDGRAVLDVKVTRGAKYWQIFLDVERDYMPVRMDIHYQVHENYNSDLSVVKEGTEVDGFWVPKTVFRRTGTSVSDGQPEYTYEVSTFTRDTISDADFEIEFPPGTEVVDAIENIAYRVLPDGGLEPLPLYDAASGEVIKPDTVVPGSESLKSDAQREDGRLWSWRTGVVIGVGIVLLLAALKLVARPRSVEDRD